MNSNPRRTYAHRHDWIDKHTGDKTPGVMIRRGGLFLFVEQADLISVATQIADAYQENAR